MDYLKDYSFDFSREKDEVLREVRHIGFTDIITAIKNYCLLDDIKHFNSDRYPNQRIFIVVVEGEIFAVPYILQKERLVIFLKTIYPSRKLRRRYIKNK